MPKIIDSVSINARETSVLRDENAGLRRQTTPFADALRYVNPEQEYRACPDLTSDADPQMELPPVRPGSDRGWLQL